MNEWTCIIPSAEDMRRVGSILGTHAQAGQLIMLDGPLGAGKTTLTGGIAQGLGIAGRISSPTFVIAMVHRNRTNRPDLVHVDAYRLESLDELDALDIDTELDTSVAVIEWGAGKTEILDSDRLEIQIVRPEGGREEESVADLFEDAPRALILRSHGERSAALIDAVAAEYKE